LARCNVAVRRPHGDVARLLAENAALIQNHVAVGERVDRTTAQRQNALIAKRNSIKTSIARRKTTPFERIVKRYVGVPANERRNMERRLLRGSHYRPGNQIATRPKNGNRTSPRGLDCGQTQVHIAGKNALGAFGLAVDDYPDGNTERPLLADRRRIDGIGREIVRITAIGREERIYRAVAADILEM